MSSEIYCQNFINQDLTFLQPSVIHTLRPKGNENSSQENVTDTSPIETQEHIPPQEQDTDLQQHPAVDVIYDRNRSINLVASIKWKKEADPN